MVNPIYTNTHVINQLKELFSQNKTLPSIQLHNFLTPKEYRQLQSSLKGINYHHVKKPLNYSYATTSFPPRALFLLPLLQTIINTFLGEKFLFKKPLLYQSKHRDYTLLHDPTMEQPGYDIIFDLTEKWNHHVGGNLVYTDGHGTSFIIPINTNVLTIIYRKKPYQKYMQYINHHAGKKKRLLLIGTIPEPTKQKHL